ncbi:MAG: amidase [Acidimicrobiales bacterium]
MQLDEYSNHDATSLAELVRAGDVHPRELAALAIEGCNKVNTELNGVVEIYDDATEQSDSDGRPLDGVPFLRKDIGATEEGRLVEMGSRLCEGMIAPRDAFYTVRAKQAGLRFLGRTTTSEMGLHGTTETVAQGATANPWDTAHIAGGSSGGASAMVAAGVVPMAHASDGAGSIRIPAACNGLVGLKPSRGRVSGGPSLGHPRVSTELVVSRTVRDTAAALDALGGDVPGEPFDLGPMPGYSELLGRPPRRLRIAMSAASPNATVVDPEVVACIEATAAMLEGFGHEIVVAEPDYGYERMRQTFADLLAITTTSALPLLAERFGRPLDESMLEPVTLRWFERAREMSAFDLDAALTVCDRIARRMGLFHQEHDLFLCPVMTGPAPLLGTHGGTQDHLTHEQSAELAMTLFPFTPAINMSGQPAISLPMAISDAGLPLAAQLVARFGDEATLLQTAAQLEAEVDWAARRPLVHVAN